MGGKNELKESLQSLSLRVGKIFFSMNWAYCSSKHYSYLQPPKFLISGITPLSLENVLETTYSLVTQCDLSVKTQTECASSFLYPLFA